MLCLTATIHSTASLGTGIMAYSNWNVVIWLMRNYLEVCGLCCWLSICLCLQCQDNEFAVSPALNYAFIPLPVPTDLTTPTVSLFPVEIQVPVRQSIWNILIYMFIFFKCHNESRLPLTFEMAFFSSFLPVLFPLLSRNVLPANA